MAPEYFYSFICKDKKMWENVRRTEVTVDMCTDILLEIVPIELI